MATILDATLLHGFAGVFSFLLVFILVFAVLSMSKVFKLSSGLAALFAFSLSILTLFSPRAVAVIRLVTPWYVTFFFLIFMLILASLFFSGEEGMAIFGDGKKFMGVVVVIGILIFIIGWAKVSKMNFPDNDIGNGSSVEYTINENGEKIPIEKVDTSLRSTIFSPAILGVLAFLLIGAAAVFLLSMS